MDNEIILENQMTIMKALKDLLIESRDVYDETKELKTQIDRTNEILKEIKVRKRIAENMFMKLNDMK